MKVEVYQLSLHLTKFLPVLGVKMEKGRLVSSLAVMHVSINLGLNNGINCLWREEAIRPKNTKKVASHGLLSN